MAGRSKRPKGLAERVGRYRRKLAQTGVRRVEVAVPTQDVPLIRHISEILRDGGAAAATLRDALGAATASGAATGADLVAFFRASPLVGVDLDIERDRSAGRPIEL